MPFQPEQASLIVCSVRNIIVSLLRKGTRWGAHCGPRSLVPCRGGARDAFSATHLFRTKPGAEPAPCGVHHDLSPCGSDRGFDDAGSEGSSIPEFPGSISATPFCAPTAAHHSRTETLFRHNGESGRPIVKAAPEMVRSPAAARDAPPPARTNVTNTTLAASARSHRGYVDLGGVPAARASAWLGHSAQEHLRTCAHAVLDKFEIDYAAVLGAPLRAPARTRLA